MTALEYLAETYQEVGNAPKASSLAIEALRIIDERNLHVMANDFFRMNHLNMLAWGTWRVYVE